MRFVSIIVVLAISLLFGGCLAPSIFKPHIDCVEPIYGVDDQDNDAKAEESYSCQNRINVALESCNDSTITQRNMPPAVWNYDLTSIGGTMCNIRVNLEMDRNSTISPEASAIPWIADADKTYLDCNIPIVDGHIGPIFLDATMEKYCTGTMRPILQKYQKDIMKAVADAKENKTKADDELSKSLSSDSMIFGKYEWSGLIPYNGDNNTADLKISVTSKFGLDLFYTVSVPNAVVQLYAYRANSKTGLVGFASPMTIDNYALLQGVNVQDSTEATLCFWYKSESDKECVKKTIQGPKIGFEINSSSVSFDINASQLLPQQTKTYKKYLVVTNQGDMKINVYSHDVMKRMGNHSLPFSYFEINPHSNAPIPVEAVVSGTECHDSTTVLGVSLCKSDPNCAYKKEIVAITRCNEAG